LLENDTKPPKANQWTIGIRQAIGQAMLSANYTNVRGYNQFTWLFGNRRENGSCCLSTETFGNLLISSDEGRTWYDALLVQLGLPFNRERGWGAQVSYTLSESEQNFGDLFTFSVLTENDFQRFPSSNDIRHRLVGNWIVALPLDFLLSGIATFTSDPPLNAQIFGDPNNDAIEPDFPEGETRNSRRFEEADFAEVNLRIEKEFGFLGGQRVGVIAEIFNVLDNENFGCPSDVFGIFNRGTGQLELRSDFGQANCVVGENPSRRLQLGLKYGF
jgi:hypothetical protein